MDQRQWHRLFGMSWTDFLTGLPFAVEMEVDLSVKMQLLDVVIVRKEAGPLAGPFPDGFEELASHNLITFKSHREALDGWTLLELLAHYVNYRKQVSPDMDNLLPETEFRLFAVVVRSPQWLARQENAVRVRPGIYELPHFTGLLRVVVVHELRQEEQNVRLHLFSAQTEAIQYGHAHYGRRSPHTSTFLNQLWEGYFGEGVPMPFTKEEFAREAIQNMTRDPALLRLMLDSIPEEKRLEGVSLEARIRGLSQEEREKLLRLLSGETPTDPS